MISTVAALLSAYVKPAELLKVGELFAAVVCTVAFLLDTLPMVVDPLFVVTENVPVNDFMEAIADKIADRCAAVSVSVVDFVPVLSCAAIVIVTIVVEPFLIAS